MKSLSSYRSCVVTVALMAASCAPRPLPPVRARPPEPPPPPGACGSPSVARNVTVHGPAVRGSRHETNYSVCTAAFLREMYQADLPIFSDENDNEDLLHWFCHTDQGSAAFSFATAAKEVLPDLPPLESPLADYSPDKRARACDYLHQHSSELDIEHVSHIFERIKDNTAALPHFASCVRTLMDDSYGGAASTTVNGGKEVCSGQTFTIVFQWQPSPGGPQETPAPFTPEISGIDVGGSLDCCPLTIQPGTQLQAYRNYGLTCRRTSPEAGTVLLHMHTGGDFFAEVRRHTPNCR